MSSATNHDKTKSEICSELQAVVRAASLAASSMTSKEVLPSELTQNICNIIEAVFVHGLRDPFFIRGSRYAKYPEPNFWPFVSKFSHRSILSQINALSQIKSEIGKGRSWIRMVLNENSLEQYILLLKAEDRSLKQFYNDYAFLRDIERVDQMCMFLKGLFGISIGSPTNSSFLNNWTPTPLILAALIPGKAYHGPMTTNPKKPIMSSVSNSHDEVGLCALHTLPVDVKLLSPIRPSRLIYDGSDDDNASVYSHPSRVGSNDKDRLPLSSTPVTSLLGEFVDPSPLPVKRKANKKIISRGSSTTGSGANLESIGISNLGLSLQTPCNMPCNYVDDQLSSSLPQESFRQESSLGHSTSFEFDVDLDLHSCGVSPVTSKKQIEEKISDKGERSHIVPSEAICKNDFDDHQVENENDKDQDFKKEEAESNLDVNLVSEKAFSEGKKNAAEKLYVPYCASKAVVISSTKAEDSPLGKSLHDEVASAALSCNSSLSGNALCSSTGGWSAPKQVLVDVDTSGVLSSSSGSSSEPVMSFDQALRAAMEQSTPTSEDSDAFASEQQPLHLSSSTECILPDHLMRSTSHSLQGDVILKMITIPIERGLVKQEFRCPMCRKSIGPPFGFAKYGVCMMDGKSYCIDCMAGGGTHCIPSRVLRSWDWSLRPISDRGRAFIDANLERPIFDITKHNKSLYEHVPSLRVVRELREQLQNVAVYLLNCRESVAADFRKRVQPREHLYKDIHTYSLLDLQNVRAGMLERQLHIWLKFAITHVMECLLCRQKGFICEVCNKNEILYPFWTSITQRCSNCHSVFHLECSFSECPKCVRRAKYGLSTTEVDVLQA